MSERVRSTSIQKVPLGKGRHKLVTVQIIRYVISVNYENVPHISDAIPN